LLLAIFVSILISPCVFSYLTDYFLHFRFYLLFIRLPLCSTLFPYTTLFRSISNLSSVDSVSHKTLNLKFSSPKCLKSSLNNLLRSEEHTSELQSRFELVCRLLLEKKKAKN